MTLSDAFFWMFALTAVLPALGILLTPSIVRMAFLLLFSLAGFAGLYLHLGAEFVGFTQVLVYIGGILILFLFGVMLTARVDFHVRKRAGLPVLVPSAIAGLLTLWALFFISVRSPWGVDPASEGRPLSGPETSDIGAALMSSYLLPFEAVSVLLLVAMVGATFIARGRDGGDEGLDRDGAEGGSDS